MRKWLPLVVAAVLLPAGAAAQKNPPRAPDVKQAPVKITQAQAVSAALGQVHNDLEKGLLKNWKTERSGGGGTTTIPASSLAAAGALFNPTNGKDWTPIYVVGISSPNAKGHVRVIVDAATGTVLASAVSSWEWGNAPAWWQQGLNAAPKTKN
jgi:hypothetical protein